MGCRRPTTSRYCKANSLRKLPGLARAGGVTLKRGVIDVAIEELTLTYERLALQ